MALRYLATRAALQHRALVPRLQPSAGSRPFSTSHPQGVLISESSKADAAGKGKIQPSRDLSKLTDEQIGQEIAKFDSICKAASEDFRNFAKYEAIRSCFLMACAATGAGLAFLTISYNIRKERDAIFGTKVHR